MKINTFLYLRNNNILFILPVFRSVLWVNCWKKEGYFRCTVAINNIFIKLLMSILKIIFLKKQKTEYFCR
jgi:hypothetical protein